MSSPRISTHWRHYPLDPLARRAAHDRFRGSRHAPGRSDYAILLLIAHCGLRACDVAALCVQDLDWRHDVIHITRTKSRSREDVPWCRWWVKR